MRAMFLVTTYQCITIENWNSNYIFKPILFPACINDSDTAIKGTESSFANETKLGNAVNLEDQKQTA